MSAKRLAYAVMTVVLAASGTYMFVYLYRWEWNRTLIAGIFFVAAEIGLVGATILERLKKIESRIETRAAEPPSALPHIQETAPEPKAGFKWLARTDGTNVFVPVLMGAGFVVSGIAWVVERLAHATARPAMERGLAWRLQPLSLPEGGFVGGGVTVLAPHPSRTKTRVKHALVTIAVAAALSLTVDALGDLTQNRPDRALPGTSSTLVVDINTRRPDASSVETATRLWAACAGTVPSYIEAPKIAALGGGKALIVTQPSLGKHTQRRLTGCLSDTTLDEVQASVVSVESFGVE
ncbi:MAG TPA: hypothetical protein VHJ76_03915 [Actinomycetota bacterium]|nr:hypothetical protein [Actinomycetota bacterium]